MVFQIEYMGLNELENTFILNMNVNYRRRRRKRECTHFYQIVCNKYLMFPSLERQRPCAFNIPEQYLKQNYQK